MAFELQQNYILAASSAAWVVGQLWHCVKADVDTGAILVPASDGPCTEPLEFPEITDDTGWTRVIRQGDEPYAYSAYVHGPNGLTYWISDPFADVTGEGALVVGVNNALPAQYTLFRPIESHSFGGAT